MIAKGLEQKRLANPQKVIKEWIECVKCCNSDQMQNVSTIDSPNMKSSQQLNYFSSNVNSSTTLLNSKQEPKEITQRLLKNFVYNQKFHFLLKQKLLSPDHPDQQCPTITSIYLHIVKLTASAK